MKTHLVPPLSVPAITFWLLCLPVSLAFSFSKPRPPHIPADPQLLARHVQVFSGISPARNHANVASLDSCARYISREFGKTKGRVAWQTYTVRSENYHNIICSFGPDNGPRLVVGAHYDVHGDLPGADDNASGTAGLLELARLLDMLNPTLMYRIDLVAYSLEEPPYFRSPYMGSAIHAQSLADKKVEVKTMLSLEMIGYFKEEKGSQDYPLPLLKLFYPNHGNYIAVVGKLGQGMPVRKTKRAMKQACSLAVRSINAPISVAGTDYSDHLNYWKQGYPAAMITDTAFLRNKNYHTAADTPDKLDYQKMAEVVKGVYWALATWQ